MAPPPALCALEPAPAVMGMDAVVLYHAASVKLACSPVGHVHFGALVTLRTGRPSLHARMSCRLGPGPHLRAARSTSARLQRLHTSRPALLPGKPSQEALVALQGMKDRQGLAPSQPYYQTLDANQVHLTRLTLSSMLRLHPNEPEIYSKGDVVQRGPPLESTLIPSEHLSFFTPRVSHDLLGKDGSDTSFNPPGGVFTRRMWAGGEMHFSRDNELKIGQECWEKTTVEDASWKELKGGRGEMIVVWVSKEIGNDRGPCLVDRRSWVFQPRLDAGQAGSKSDRRGGGTTAAASTAADSSQPPSALASSPTPSQLVQDPGSLFRYSALTFNAHAIHLSPPWAQDVEGHPDIVVHGPLNLCLLLRKWGRDMAGWTVDEEGRFVLSNPHKRIKTVTYRAKSPIHAGIPYWIGFPSTGQGKEGRGDTVVAVKADGQVAMEATVTAW